MILEKLGRANWKIKDFIQGIHTEYVCIDKPVITNNRLELTNVGIFEVLILTFKNSRLGLT